MPALSGFDDVFRFSHDFRSANSSSKSVSYTHLTSPDTYTLYPTWVCDCIYANSPREQIEENDVTDAFRENYRYEQIVVDAQTCDIQSGWIERDEGMYHAEPMTWGKMQ